MAENTFDVIIIGSGPGGYVAAIRAAQLGFKTAIIEKHSQLGGTCLNVGCIPSKALLHSTEIYHAIAHQSADNGIKVKGLECDIPTMMAKKNRIVDQLRGGIKALMKANKIDVFSGTGKITSPTQVEVGSQILNTKNIIIATGSQVVELPFLKFDGQTVVSSDHAIAFDAVPKKIVIVGAGAIGLELGSVWQRLGSDVTIVELLPRIAITFDHEVSKLAERIFKKQGIKFELDAKVTGMKKNGKTILLTAEKEGKELEFPADKIIICVGRKPYTEGLGLETVGIERDKQGRIITDEHFRTNVPNIFAIGDVIKGPMLAHKAEEEGVALAEMLAGKAGHVNYDVIPNVIYTNPELASVGISEQEAKEQNRPIKVGKFPFAANGRALASDAGEGFVKVISDAKTDRILGVQIIGPHASELIAPAVAHMEYGGSAEDMARTIAAHPTLSEALKEAALACEKRAIHSV